MITVINTATGTRYTGNNPTEIIKQMKLQDWSGPASFTDYKERVQKRTAAIQGVTFVYWDATSFLLGMANADLVRIKDWHYENIKQRRIK